MKKVLFKILPMLAIVAGIAGAFGFNAQQNPCETELVGYEYTPTPENPLPPAPPGPESNTTLIEGQFGVDYECSASPNTCRFIYAAPDPEEPELKQWIRCEGDLER